MAREVVKPISSPLWAVAKYLNTIHREDVIARIEFLSCC